MGFASLTHPIVRQITCKKNPALASSVGGQGQAVLSFPEEMGQATLVTGNDAILRLQYAPSGKAIAATHTEVTTPWPPPSVKP